MRVAHRVLLASLLSGSTASAQERPIKGVIVTAERAPVPGANVFVLETLDGLVTGADGRFSIRTTEQGAVTLIVKRLGYEQAQRVVAPAERDSVVITMTRATVSLSTVAVQAGAYTAGEERGATLTRRCLACNRLMKARDCMSGAVIIPRRACS
jgi:hypothetical protein